MSMKAIKALYTTQSSITPGARTVSANGAGVDLANAEENQIVVVGGTWTDGTHTFTLQESADNATFTNVAAANQIGAFTPISSANTAAATNNKVSYIGALRYIRVIVTVAGDLTGAVDAAIANTKPRKAARAVMGVGFRVSVVQAVPVLE